MTVPPEHNAQSGAAFEEALRDIRNENSNDLSGSRQDVLRQTSHSLSELERLQARIAAVETGIEWGKTG